VGPVGPALPRWAEPAASLLVHPYLRACAAERIGRCRRMRVRRRARARWRLAGPPSLSAPCFLWPHAVVVRGSRAGRAGVGVLKRCGRRAAPVRRGIACLKGACFVECPSTLLRLSTRVPCFG
jgi:hypothetical protein